MFVHRLISNAHRALIPVKHRPILAYVCRRFGQPFRAPKQQVTIILSQLIIRRVIQRPRRTVICAKMTKTASGVPILWETFLGVLRVLFLVRNWDHAYATFGADPCADSAAGAFVHVELVPAPEPFGEKYLLVGVFHGESAFEDVFDSFIHLV